MTYRFPQSRDWFVAEMDTWLQEHDTWECKPLRCDTRHMAAESTHKVVVAHARTQTMPTQVEQR